MTDTHVVSATLEDYVEAIAHLVAEKGVARVRDISRALSVHKSTVTAALKTLTEKNLVNYAPYEAATLTPQGERVAEEVIRRHEVIQRFLSEVLCLDSAEAQENACRMEHVMGRNVLQRLSLFAEFVKENLDDDNSWFRQFRESAHSDPNAEDAHLDNG